MPRDGDAVQAPSPRAVLGSPPAFGAGIYLPPDAHQGLPSSVDTSSSSWRTDLAPLCFNPWSSRCLSTARAASWYPASRGRGAARVLETAPCWGQGFLAAGVETAPSCSCPVLLGTAQAGRCSLSACSLPQRWGQGRKCQHSALVHGASSTTFVKALRGAGLERGAGRKVLLQPHLVPRCWGHWWGHTSNPGVF